MKLLYVFLGWLKGVWHWAVLFTVWVCVLRGKKGKMGCRLWLVMMEMRVRSERDKKAWLILVAQYRQQHHYHYCMHRFVNYSLFTSPLQHSLCVLKRAPLFTIFKRPYYFCNLSSSTKWNSMFFLFSFFFFFPILY